jgi:hypothetical protein
MAQTMRSIFGFRAAPIDPTPPEDGKVVAKRILARSTDISPAFSLYQLSLLNDVLAALSTQDELSDSDIELVGRVIGDTRVNRDEFNQGRSTIETLFRNHADQLAIIIPLVLVRLKSPETPRSGNFQRGLDGVFISYPVERLQPYGASMRELIETGVSGPIDGVLSRVAEVDGNVSGIIAKYLDGELSNNRQAASIAICRATPANWITLKPIAVAHLNDAVRRRLPTVAENHGLLLALARFGEKDVALKAIENARINIQDPIPDPQGQREKDALDREIKSLKTDFPPDRCLKRINNA